MSEYHRGVLAAIRAAQGTIIRDGLTANERVYRALDAMLRLTPFASWDEYHAFQSRRA